DTVTNRPSAAPAALGRNQPSTSRLTVASTVVDRATAPSIPTGTITNPLPVSSAAASSTVAVGATAPAVGATVTCPPPPAPATVRPRATAPTPPLGTPAWPSTGTLTA